MGDDGGGGRNGHRSGGDSAACGVVFAAYEGRKPAAGDYALKRHIWARMLSLGVTSFLSQISLVAAMAAINNMLRKYGAADEIFGQEQYAQIPMAVVGIVMKFFQIVISVVVGMAAGVFPLSAIIWGKKKSACHRLFIRLLIAEAVVELSRLFWRRRFLLSLLPFFGAKNESSYYTDFAVRAFRIYLCMMIPACVNKPALFFCGGGQSLSSILLSMLRESCSA